MILTVTINPLLERRFSFNKIVYGSENRNGHEIFSAGGKGINVSRQLNCLKTKNIALTFLGGANGKIFSDVLAAEKIYVVPVKIKNETRNAVVVFEESSCRVTTFFNSNTKISSSEAEAFISKMNKLIKDCEIVVFSGSSSCKETDIIFPAGIETANRSGKISLCDTYGNHLIQCIEKSPSIIHNNVSETEKTLNISLKSQKQKMDYLDFLYSKGIRQAYLTDGGLPLYASNINKRFTSITPKIKVADSTGSGDGFAAGIVYSIHKNKSFGEGLAIASSIGALNAASMDVCRVNLKDINKLKKTIIVSQVPIK